MSQSERASKPLFRLLVKSVWIWVLLVAAFTIVVLGILHPLFHPTPPAELPSIARTNLVRLGNLWCRAGTTNPFNGFLLDYYADGVLASRSMISNGLVEGLSEGWYTNGQLQIRETYHTNFSDGLRIKWYPDGRKLSEATIVQGQMQGVFRRWYENGKLAEEIPMRDGKIEGLGRSYYESGCLKTEITIHDGNVVKSDSWPDGVKPGGRN